MLVMYPLGLYADMTANHSTGNSISMSMSMSNMRVHVHDSMRVHVHVHVHVRIHVHVHVRIHVHACPIVHVDVTYPCGRDKQRFPNSEQPTRTRMNRCTALHNP